MQKEASGSFSPMIKRYGENSSNDKLLTASFVVFPGFFWATASWCVERDKTAEFFIFIFEKHKEMVISFHYIQERTSISTADVSKGATHTMDKIK